MTVTIKHALLALLSQGHSTTYSLKRDFEASTGQAWPLNVGQVHTTLQRLERDGLVRRLDPEPSADGSSVTEPYEITDAGREELAQWWQTPVARLQPARDELVIKLAMAVSIHAPDIAGIVQRQRSATMRALHDFTRLKSDPKARDAQHEPLVWELVLENHIYTAEAELRWLDQIEGTVARAARTPRKAAPAPAQTHLIREDHDQPTPQR